MWKAIATGPGMMRWFSPFARVEGGDGGTVSVAWVEGADWLSRIAVWEPDRHLRLVDLSDPEAAAAGAASTVDFHLEAAGGNTRIRLVNSGLPATPEWDEHFHMMTNGWRFFLWNLKHALERHPGVPRRMISARPWVTGSRGEAWERLFGEEGQANGGEVATRTGANPGSIIHASSLAVGNQFHFVLDGGEVLSGTIVLANRPWAFAGMLDSLNDGVLHVEMEGSGERWKMGVWLSAYGVEEGWCGELDLALNATMSRLFAGDS